VDWIGLDWMRREGNPYVVVDIRWVLSC